MLCVVCGGVVVDDGRIDRWGGGVGRCWCSLLCVAGGGVVIDDGGIDRWGSGVGRCWCSLLCVAGGGVVVDDGRIDRWGGGVGRCSLLCAGGCGVVAGLMLVALVERQVLW
ncbi:hypothetical protein [Bartonella machadoae]|uniref:hypothetical protein n=1 Tax=Bartonella machadoae TaxID=2893471 RepID=UPI001F4CBD59|nr:hypothetical protein [Bartonella machadoae]UNE53962.1 hypothetical protein LNM86_10335 [Bartonella machadoae]